MSFSRKVKEELARQESAARHCLIAEFAAIFTLCGKVKTAGGGRIRLQIDRKLDSCPKILYLIRENISCPCRGYST